MLAPDIRRVRPDEAGLLTTLAEPTFRDAWQDDNDPEDFETYCHFFSWVEKRRPGSCCYLDTCALNWFFPSCTG